MGALSFPFIWFRSYLGTGWNILLRFPLSIFSSFTVVAFVLFLVGVGVGFWRLWKKQHAARPVLASVAVFCLSFSLVHIFWHVADARYFILLVPFSLIFLVRAAGPKRVGENSFSPDHFVEVYPRMKTGARDLSIALGA